MAASIVGVRCTDAIIRLRIGAPDNPTGAVRVAANGPAVPECRILRGLDGVPHFRLADAVTNDGRLRLRLEIIGEQHFYGLGQGGSTFDRLGQARLLWNSHVNHGGGGDIAIPLLLSHVGVGLFFDTASRTLIDAGDSYDRTWIEMSVDGAGLDVYVLAAVDLRGLMGVVAQLLGPAAVPPRWVLGFMQSTRHFADAAELAALVAKFRARHLPIDAIALLSSYGTALGWNHGVGSLECAAALLPDPAATFAAWHADHVHVVLHEYPVLARRSPLYPAAVAAHAVLDAAYPEAGADGQPTANWHEGQSYLDFGGADAGGWWWAQHDALCALGVDGWWLDGGEGPFPDRQDDGLAALHNRYDLQRQRAFAAGEARDRPAHRPFLLCRSGGPGMQALGAACWSGDVNGTFATLAAQVPLGLNVGMSGVPWWGTDIGGYYRVLADTAELYVRWFQFAAFCPVFRAHGREWRHHLPWAHGDEAEAICRRLLELRYRLHPYNTTLAWQAHLAGLPLMRPMALNYPDDPSLRDVGDQYCWGDALLVAPVTKPGVTHWPVQLPAGIWYDWWTQEAFFGGRGITVFAPLDRIPLFVAAGAIVPLGPVRQDLDDPAPQTLTVLIYPGVTATDFTLYEDDGQPGHAPTLIRFTCDPAPDAITCRVATDTATLRDCTLRVRLSVAPPALEPGWSWQAPFVTIPLSRLPATVCIRN